MLMKKMTAIEKTAFNHDYRICAAAPAQGLMSGHLSTNLAALLQQ
jgi:hypothetical protein